MRPVDRGTAPQSYKNYQDAQKDLIERIGDYCSYCERQIETNLAVEHIQPKTKVPELRNEWANFLLGCVNCNSCKGDKDVELEHFFWPDTDNTMRAFHYVDSLVVPHPALPPTEASKAQATIELFGLDRDPGQTDAKKKPTEKDMRWQARAKVWELAHRERSRLEKDNSTNIRELIVEVAVSRGMFSIWMSVFEQDADMRCRLISAFKGTSVSCFDLTTGAVLARTGGKL